MRCSLCADGLLQVLVQLSFYQYVHAYGSQYWRHLSLSLLPKFTLSLLPDMTEVRSDGLQSSEYQ